ncbi:hypothetical protein KDH_12640 [Dictyobacter sp. S3.2.2.5]|uniref:CHAT domain-containing protein n=1 Tax=Dictyobacter halimunensis TaxID=3026934 RepID=A0ABQ6FL49_9CHLR|nr:hypothetical protein KDH_12640 [Dictyobacter sp. S3.2.2.5]
MISWYLPITKANESALNDDEIVAALQMLVEASSLAQIAKVIETKSFVFSSYTPFQTFYLTMLYVSYNDDEDVTCNTLSYYAPLLCYAQIYGVSEVQQRLREAIDDQNIDIAELFPLDLSNWIELLERLVHSLFPDDDPLLCSLVYQELGDLYSMMFNETLDKAYLEPARARYTRALSWFVGRDLNSRSGYLYLQRANTVFLQAEQKEADAIETVITDLEVALKCEHENTEIRGKIYRLQGEAYSRRFYGLRKKNIALAIEAYKAALSDLPRTVEHEAILYCLTTLYRELCDEQALKEIFAAWRDCAQYLEQVAEAQLQMEEVSDPDLLAAHFEPEVLTSTLEQWLGLYDQNLQYDFLCRNGAILVSEEALVILRQLKQKAEVTSENGRAEYLAMMLVILEDARKLSLDVAWQRYILAVLPVIECMNLLMIASSFQEMNRRIFENLDLFLSPTMFAILYMASQDVNSTVGAQSVAQTIKLLKQMLPGTTSSVPLPSSMSAKAVATGGPDRQEEYDEGEPDEPSIVRKPADFLDIAKDDLMVSQVLMEEMLRLSPEQLNALLPLFTVQSLDQVRDTTQAKTLGEKMYKLIDLVDAQQTPHIKAVLLIAGLQAKSMSPQQVLEQCERILALVDRQRFAYGWMAATLMRGNTHGCLVIDDTTHLLSKDERHFHIQQSLRDMDAVSAFFDIDGKMYERAAVRLMRGMMLFELWLITREACDFETILADFTEAAPIIDRYGKQWQLMTLYVYQSKIINEVLEIPPREKFERIIACCNAAIVCGQGSTSPFVRNLWACALIIRGAIYVERLNGGKRDNVEQAIKDLNLALSLLTKASHLEDWATALTNRGYAYMARVVGEKAENLEQAIKDFSDVLQALEGSAFLSLTCTALLNRGYCYLQRTIRDRVHNQQLALDDTNSVLALMEKIDLPATKAAALTNRAAIYTERLAGDAYENLLQARQDCDVAIEIFEHLQMSLKKARLLTSRGRIFNRLSALLARDEWHVGMRTRIQTLAETFGQPALKLFNDTHALIQLALDDFTAALNIFTYEHTPLEWAQTLRERAITYAFKPQMDGYNPENLQRAIFDFDSALTIFSREETPFEWASTIANRGLIYAELARINGQVDDAQHALLDLDAAQTVCTARVAPAMFCRAQYTKVRVHWLLKQWSQVHYALSEMRKVQRDLVASAAVSNDQALMVAEFSQLDIYALDAWVMSLIEPIDTVAMAIVLEEGRARAQRIALDLDDIHLERMPAGEARDRMKTFLTARNTLRKMQYQVLNKQSSEQSVNVAYNAFVRARELIRNYDNPDFMTPVPTREGIERSLTFPNEALVYLVASSVFSGVQGIAVIVRRDHAGTVAYKHLLLPRLSEHLLYDLFETVDGTQQVRIDAALSELGKFGMTDVVACLLQDHVRKVHFVPYGVLGLLPLPSVQVSINGMEPQPTSAFFEEITILPSARSLELSHTLQSRPERKRQTLFLAGNPTPLPSGIATLQYAEPEAETIKRVAQQYGYTSSHICHLLPRSITRNAVIEKLESAQYAHLALHGLYCVGDPRSSRLVLAGGDGIEERERSIYLGEVLDGAIKLRGLRLLVLSACETSIVDIRRVPNESLGLAAGFLQAGTAAVIATLWPVDDQATYLLMTRFAQLYLDPQGLWSPGRALHAAQHWLRLEATNAVLASFDPLDFQYQPSGLRLSYERMQSNIQSLARNRIANGEPEALPFADPFFWAGFIVVGA